jgi:predicted phage tail protein
MSANTRADIFRCINANRPEFRNYLVDCHENNIDFIVEYQGETADEEDLLLPLEEGDVTIAIVPAGSKKGLGKILAAIAIVTVMFMLPGTFGTTTFGAGGMGPGFASLANGLSFTGMVAGSLAINLALTGIGELMAPDPSVDTDQPENYTFNGNQQHIAVGDPVPLLYGELRVPGRPISIDIKNGTYTNPATWIDGNGELNTITDESRIDTSVYDSWSNI